MADTVEQLVAASQRAIERRDAQSAATLFHPNANVPLPSGEYGMGREAIAEHFEVVLPDMPQDLRHVVTEEHVHYVTPSLAVVDSIGENVRTAETGDPETISREAFVMIAVREHDDWLWAAIRGTVS